MIPTGAPLQLRGEQVSENTIVSSLRGSYRAISLNPKDAVPGNLYHYTSASGLFGILNSGILRASNFSYLNDATEVRYGESIVREALADFIRESSGRSKTILEATATTLDQLGSHLEFYMTCFCVESDLLSQWRGYGSTTGRFCISFETEELFYQTPSLKYHLDRVTYERTEQLDKIKTIISRAVKAAQEMEQLDAAAQKECAKGICGVLFDKLIREICFFKHPGFSEEREWRAVHEFEDASKIRFEPSGGSIRPYVELFSGAGDQPTLPISRIVVGSSHLAQQSKKSVQLLLTARGYADVNITESGIPYRDV